MTKKRLCTLGASLALLAGLQLLLFGFKRLIFCFCPRTGFSDRMASLAGMLLLTAAVFFFARRRGWNTAFLPERFGLRDWLGAAVFLVLLLATPLLTGQDTAEQWLMILYGSVITPLYEETVFRGILWERLTAVFPRGWQVYLINAALFGLWHLGYWDSIALRVTADAVGNVMLWKTITGLGFGLVLGLLRLRTKNAFSTALLHGAMNLLAR